MNYRYFEIYNIDFNKIKLDEIKSILSLDKSKLILVDKEEIEKGFTNSGIKIGDNSKAILQ